MILTQMENRELLRSTKALASEERKTQVELLWHLLEIQRRKLFLEIGYESLYDYVVKELGYGNGAAYRRIQAMRLLESVPSVARKIEEGKINISTAAQVQNFIKAEKRNGGSVSYQKRVEIVEAIENKSSRDVEKHLIHLRPENVVQTERVRFVTAEMVEIKLMVPDALKEKFDRLRLHFSHVVHDMTYLRLLEYLADRALAKIEQKSKEKFARRPEFKRNIPAVLRQTVWMRDGGVCSYSDPQSGKKCGGKYQLQIDHIQPWSLGGATSLDNLRLLCGNHNRHKGARPSNSP